jgi:hypothetical protein
MPSIIGQRRSERTCGKCESRTPARLSSGQSVKDKFSPTYTKVESRTGDFTAMTRQFSQSTPSIAGSIWSRRGNGSRCAISFHSRSTRSTSRRWRLIPLSQVPNMWYKDAVCGGHERVFSGCERSASRQSRWGQKAKETATGMRIRSSRHRKNWKPTPRIRFRPLPLYVDEPGTTG